MTTALNPKSIIFFLTFMLQFMEPELPFGPETVMLGGTFFVLAIMIVIAYVPSCKLRREKIADV